MIKKKIALSLPYTYLSGAPESKRDAVLLEMFGRAEKALPMFKEHLSGIEIGNFNHKAPTEKIVTAIRAVWEKGLEVITHPSLPMEIEGSSIGDIYPWLKGVLGEAPDYQDHFLLNLHTLSSDTLETGYLLEKTIENLNTLKGFIEEEIFPITLAVEINREKGQNDPSTNYENLLQICRRVDGKSIGIGWDFGHTYSNVIDSLIPKVPPLEFVQRVVHTHIHDLGRSNQTHWPLTVGKLPLGFYMEQLQSVHYTGYHTLELYPERFADALSADEAMLESIRILKH